MPLDSPDPPRRSMAVRRYWRRVLMLTVVLLAVWTLVGPVLSIVLAEPLNRVRLGGFPLGFWFAQQGSILLFLALILIYALAMNALDRRFHREASGGDGGGAAR